MRTLVSSTLPRFSVLSLTPNGLMNDRFDAPVLVTALGGGNGGSGVAWRVALGERGATGALTLPVTPAAVSALNAACSTAENP